MLVPNDIRDECRAVLTPVTAAKQDGDAAALVQSLGELCTMVCLGGEPFVRAVDAEEYLNTLGPLLQHPALDVQILAVRSVGLVADLVPRGSSFIVAHETFDNLVRVAQGDLSDDALADEVLRCFDILCTEARDTMLTNGALPLLLGLTRSYSDRIATAALSCIASLLAAALPAQWKQLEEPCRLLARSTLGLLNASHSTDDRVNEAAAHRNLSRDAEVLGKYFTSFAHLFDRLCVTESNTKLVFAAVGDDVLRCVDLLLEDAHRYESPLKMHNLAHGVLVALWFAAPETFLATMVRRHMMASFMARAIEQAQIAGSGRRRLGGLAGHALSGLAGSSFGHNTHGAAKAEEQRDTTFLDVLLVMLPPAASVRDDVRLSLPFHVWEWEDDFRNHNTFDTHTTRRVEYEYQYQRKNRFFAPFSIQHGMRPTTLFFNTLRQGYTATVSRPFFRCPLPRSIELRFPVPKDACTCNGSAASAPLEDTTSEAVLTEEHADPPPAPPQQSTECCGCLSGLATRLSRKKQRDDDPAQPRRRRSSEAPGRQQHVAPGRSRGRDVREVFMRSEACQALFLAPTTLASLLSTVLPGLLTMLGSTVDALVARHCAVLLHRVVSIAGIAVTAGSKAGAVATEVLRTHCCAILQQVAYLIRSCSTNLTECDIAVRGSSQGSLGSAGMSAPTVVFSTKAEALMSAVHCALLLQDILGPTATLPVLHRERVSPALASAEAFLSDRASRDDPSAVGAPDCPVHCQESELVARALRHVRALHRCAASMSPNLAFPSEGTRGLHNTRDELDTALAALRNAEPHGFWPLLGACFRTLNERNLPLHEVAAASDLLPVVRERLECFAAAGIAPGTGDNAAVTVARSYLLRGLTSYVTTNDPHTPFFEKDQRGTSQRERVSAIKHHLHDRLLRPLTLRLVPAPAHTDTITLHGAPVPVVPSTLTTQVAFPAYATLQAVGRDVVTRHLSAKALEEVLGGIASPEPPAADESPRELPRPASRGRPSSEHSGRAPSRGPTASDASNESVAAPDPAVHEVSAEQVDEYVAVLWLHGDTPVVADHVSLIDALYAHHPAAASFRSYVELPLLEKTVVPKPFNLWYTPLSVAYAIVRRADWLSSIARKAHREVGPPHATPFPVTPGQHIAEEGDPLLCPQRPSHTASLRPASFRDARAAPASPTDTGSITATAPSADDHHVALAVDICARLHAWFDRPPLEASIDDDAESSRASLPSLDASRRVSSDGPLRAVSLSIDERKLCSAVVEHVRSNYTSFAHSFLGKLRLDSRSIATEEPWDEMEHDAALVALQRQPSLFPFALRRTLLLDAIIDSRYEFPRHALHAATTRRGSSGAEAMFSANQARRQKLVIKRPLLLEHGSLALRLHASNPLLLDIEFDGEVGTGPGPTSEFFSSLAVALSQNPDPHSPLSPAPSHPTDLVWQVTESRAAPLFPALSPNTATRLLRLRDVGLLVGRCLRDRRAVDLRLHPVLWRAVANPGEDAAASSGGLGAIDAVLDRSLVSLLSHTAEELEALDLRFTLPWADEVALCPHGGRRTVDQSNIFEYVDSVRSYVFHRHLPEAAAAFRSGVSAVFNPTALALFSAEELDFMLRGRQGRIWATPTAFLEAVVCDHGYSDASPPVVALATTIARWEASEQRAFLMFLSGSDCLPHEGLQPRITVVRRDTDDDAPVPGTSDDPEAHRQRVDLSLPTVNTCFHYVKLPPYSSAVVLERQLRYAIREGQGSFLLS